MPCGDYLSKFTADVRAARLTCTFWRASGWLIRRLDPLNKAMTAKVSVLLNPWIDVIEFSPKEEII